MKSFYLLTILFLFLKCGVLPSSNPVYRPNSSVSGNNESAEFRTLLEKDLINKKRVNAEVLTYLLNDTDPAEKATAAVIENQSRCNIIVRLVGVSNKQIYNLPISAHSKNQFVIQKGRYTLKSNICGANYYSQKNVVEPLILKLANN